MPASANSSVMRACSRDVELPIVQSADQLVGPQLAQHQLNPGMIGSKGPDEVGQVAVGC
jgi:hypothetical protein